jgi:hypothetical protein
MGILFKFALDKELVRNKWMYGDRIPNDSLAMKAGTSQPLRVSNLVPDRLSDDLSRVQPTTSFDHLRAFWPLTRQRSNQCLRL